MQHDRSQGCEARSAKNSSHYPFSRSGRLCTFGQIERGTPAFSAFLMHTLEPASTVRGRCAPRAVGFSQVASPAKRSKSTPLESNVCSGRRYGSRGRQTTASEPRKTVIRCLPPCGGAWDRHQWREFTRDYLQVLNLQGGTDPNFKAATPPEAGPRSRSGICSKRWCEDRRCRCARRPL